MVEEKYLEINNHNKNMINEETFIENQKPIVLFSLWEKHNDIFLFFYTDKTIRSDISKKNDSEHIALLYEILIISNFQRK